MLDEILSVVFSADLRNNDRSRVQKLWFAHTCCLILLNEFLILFKCSVVKVVNRLISFTHIEPNFDAHWEHLETKQNRKASRQ